LDPQLLNPDGKLLPEILSRMFFARKNRPIWAKEVKETIEFDSLEGRQAVHSGDYLCRGIQGEFWPQSKKKLLQTYDPTQNFDSEGWQQFAPKPDGPVVRAAQVDTPFRVVSSWGELTGKKNDYVVASSTNQDDVWIVDGSIFEASYQRIPTPS
jgi:hypothetical protein